MQQKFKVEGMSCQHCVRAVTQAIEDLDPEAEVKIDLASGQVEVAAAPPRETIRRAIQDAGYQAI